VEKGGGPSAAMLGYVVAQFWLYARGIRLKVDAGKVILFRVFRSNRVLEVIGLLYRVFRSNSFVRFSSVFWVSGIRIVLFVLFS
jgi:hypothetical protein